MDPWTRHHDDPSQPVAPQPLERFHPATGGWSALLAIVQRAEAEKREVRASGSHWALSRAALTDGFQVETNDPKPDINSAAFSPLNKTLYEVIPGCMTDAAKAFLLAQKVKPFDASATPNQSQFYLYHVEAGTTIYELYCRLDTGDTDPASLANQHGFRNYRGPWAMQTLGGAGGQTIVGALTTGTHGGDVLLPPIADAVQALHLIGVGGTHYWIENPLRPGVDLCDDERLKKIYPEIEVIRDPDLLKTTIVTAGRLGIIYSVVLRVVRQFALQENRKESTWSDVKKWITKPTDPMFNHHFVAVSLNPNAQADDKNQHTCFVTTRDLVSLDKAQSSPGNFVGRVERCGIGSNGKSLAGNSYPLDVKGHGSFHNAMCESDSPLHAAVSILIGDLMTIRNYWFAIMAVSSFFFPAAHYYARAMFMITEGAIAVLDRLRSIMPHGPLGTTLAAVSNWAALTNNFEIMRRLCGIAFEQDQGIRQLTAISYAIMDVHAYRGDSCIPWGDSVEVFFEASDNEAVTFVDNLLRRVVDFESQRLAFGGYVCIRFMGRSSGFIAMQKWDRTCSLEVAGMGEVYGTEPFLRDTERDAIDLNATIHWGQRNNASMYEVEKMYDASEPNGALFKWRRDLSRLTSNGRLATFSTEFTRQHGLEVVQPQVQEFTVTPVYNCAGSTSQVAWNAIDNPPGTVAELSVIPAGSVLPMNKPGSSSLALAALQGTSDEVQVPAGMSQFTLTVSTELNGRTRTARASRTVIGVEDHESLSQTPPVNCLMVDGEPHWGAEVTFDSAVGSDLAVEELYARFHFLFGGLSRTKTGEPVVQPSWYCRRAGVSTLVFSDILPRHSIPDLPPLRGLWTFYVGDWGCRGIRPHLQLEFKLVCQK